MRHMTRIRMAVLAAAFFLGGLTTAGFGLRATRDDKTVTAVLRPRTEVIHQTRIRTVHIRPTRPHPGAAAPAQAAPSPQPQVVAIPAARTAPVVVQAPTKVKSRVSPTGGREREGSERGDD